MGGNIMDNNELTGSGTATGTIMLLSTLPAVLIGPFSGLIADRVNRKFLIVGMDFIRGIVVLWLEITHIKELKFS